MSMIVRLCRVTGVAQRVCSMTHLEAAVTEGLCRLVLEVVEGMSKNLIVIGDYDKITEIGCSKYSVDLIAYKFSYLIKQMSNYFVF